MSIPSFIRAYEASAEVNPNRIVIFSDTAASSKVAQAASSTGPMIGVSDSLGAALGGMCDVTRGGIAEVELGGTVAAGDPLTADADGKAIKAVPAAGVTRRYAAFAEEPGVSGDRIKCYVAPGFLHEPA